MKEPKKPDPFTRAELRTVEEGAREHFPAYCAFILTLARTGMRIGEVRALQWREIDWKLKRARVCRNFPVGHDLTTPKTESSRRYVDLSDELMAALGRHKTAQKALALKAGWRAGKWVFTNSVGKPVKYYNFRPRVWDELLKKVELQHRGVHQLRHTFATLLLMAGENLLYVSRQLGHRGAKVTLDVYAQWIPEEASHRGVNVLDASQDHPKEGTGE